MEVIYDLDVEAQKVANKIGLKMVRAATAGTHPAFLRMIRALILERTSNSTPLAIGFHPPRRDSCPADCCLPTRRI
jgi:ferrochelatase